MVGDDNSNAQDKKARQHRPGTITMREVASQAGVSLMTVSRVINNETNVASHTRDAVLQAIEELHYTPNLTARRLAGAEFFRIGMLYNNPSVTFLSEFLLGVLEESTRSGHHLVVEKCGLSPAAERSDLKKLLQIGVDGLILPPPLCEAKAVLAVIADSDIPAVAVGAGCPSQTMATVRIDNYKAARKMTHYLLSLGHRRIGFIKGNPNQSVSDQRLQGFQDVLREAAIEPDPAMIEQGYFSYASGLSAADRLLHLAPPPTAIFAANDDMAAAALSTAHRLGIEVPAQLSVAGFDDALIGSTVWPTLTTVRQPIAAMGRAAIVLLVEQVRRRRNGDPGPPGQELLRHSLVRRESTAAPMATCVLAISPG